MNIDIKRLKNIARDIINDDSWVNDSHTKAEHNGIRNGLERLLNHLVETNEPSNTEMILELFNNFVDYIEDQDINMYNEACVYADNKEKEL